MAKGGIEPPARLFSVWLAGNYYEPGGLNVYPKQFSSLRVDRLLKFPIAGHRYFATLFNY
jgi:hypothetical protein